MRFSPKFITRSRHLAALCAGCAGGGRRRRARRGRPFVPALINPLVLGYLLALGYITLAGADTWEQMRERTELSEGARVEGAAAKGRPANDEDANSS
jgi:hypothetical protein